MQLYPKTENNEFVFAATCVFLDRRQEIKRRSIESLCKRKMQQEVVCAVRGNTTNVDAGSLVIVVVCFVYIVNADRTESPEGNKSAVMG